MARTLGPSRAGSRAVLAAAALALAGALGFVLFSQAARPEARASAARGQRAPAASASPGSAGRHEAAKSEPRRPGGGAAERQGEDAFEPVAEAWASGELARYGLPQCGGRQGAPLRDGLGIASPAPTAQEPAASLLASAEEEGSAAAPDPVSEFLEQGLAKIDKAVGDYTIYPIGRSSLQVSAAYDGSSCLYLSFHALFKAPL